MNFEVLETIFYTSLLSVAVPLVILGVKFKGQPLDFKWLAIFLGFYLLSEITSRILYIMGEQPNISVGIYYILSWFLLSPFFYYAIGWKTLRLPLVVINVFYFLFALGNFLFVQKLSHNSYSQTFQSLVILVFSILFFYKLIKELPIQQINRLPLFWVISGFFFSYSGKLVIYGISHYLIHNREDNMIIVWAFHNFLSIIGNLLIIVGVLLQSRQPRPQPA